MKQIFFQFLLMLTINSFLIAENPGEGIIIGKLTDSFTNLPIEYASISLYNVSDSILVDGTITNEHGEFSIDDIEIGKYFLKVQYVGYETTHFSDIELENKTKTDLGTLSISAKPFDLEETEVTSFSDYIQNKLDKKVVKVSEQTSADGNPVIDALVNVPSIQVDAAGNVSLRGSESFTLLIDGKPSILEASTALNQIPASSVEQVEIITNPSAKYDAEGTSGIINIISKKQKITGFNGLASIMLATGDKIAANILFNKKWKQIRSGLGISYSNKRKRTESIDDRYKISNDSTFSQLFSSDRDITRKNLQFDFNLGFDLNDQNTFSVNYKTGNWLFDRSLNSKLESYYQPNDINKSILHENFKNQNEYYSGDLDYIHQFKKKDHHIRFNAFASIINNEAPNNIFINDFADKLQAETNQNTIEINGNSTRAEYQFKTDYELPISELTKIELGSQINLNSSSTIYDYKSENDLNNTLNQISGDFDFYRNIFAAYATYQSEFKSFNIKVGVRMEYYNDELEENQSSLETSNSKLDIFPSFHISKAISKKQELSFSYNKRIGRPNQWMILPSPYSSGRNMLKIGNPEIEPDYTHSMELGYSIMLQKISIFSNLYYRKTNHSISAVNTLVNQVYFETYKNIDLETTLGFEFMSQLSLKKYWKINLSANAYHQKIYGNLEDGYLINQKTFSWYGSFRNTFIIKKHTYFEFLAIYYGPSILPQGSTKDFYYFDFFLKRNFLKKKLSVTLRSHNTFDTGIYEEKLSGSNFKTDTWFKYEGPTFMITLTYKINQLQNRNKSKQPDMNFDSGLDH